MGKYTVDLAGDGYGIEFFERQNVTLGIGQINQETFQGIQRNHPELGGSWFSLPHDHTLAIRSTAFRLADIRATEVDTGLSRPDQIIETLVSYNGGVKPPSRPHPGDPLHRPHLADIQGTPVDPPVAYRSSPRATPSDRTRDTIVTPH